MFGLSSALTCLAVVRHYMLLRSGLMDYYITIAEIATLFRAGRIPASPPGVPQGTPVVPEFS